MLDQSTLEQFVKDPRTLAQGSEKNRGLYSKVYEGVIPGTVTKMSRDKMGDSEYDPWVLWAAYTMCNRVPGVTVAPVIHALHFTPKTGEVIAIMEKLDRQCRKEGYLTICSEFRQEGDLDSIIEYFVEADGIGYNDYRYLDIALRWFRSRFITIKDEDGDVIEDAEGSVYFDAHGQNWMDRVDPKAGSVQKVLTDPFSACGSEHDQAKRFYWEVIVPEVQAFAKINPSIIIKE